MNPEIHYWTNNPDPAFPLSLSIANNGMATLTVGTNSDNPEFGSVGVFVRKLEKHEMDDLITSLQSREFIGLQNPKSTLPGTPVRRLSIKEQGRDEVSRWISMGNPNQPVFIALEAKALVLVDLVRQYPLYSVGMKMSSMPAQIERGKPTEFTMTFVNYGHETIQFPHPEGWSRNALQLQLTGLRNDVPLEDLQEYHQKTENLFKKHILNIKGPVVTKSLITLQATNQLIFKFRINLDWPPGQYDVQLSLITPLLDQKGKKQLDCKLISKPFSVKIVGKPKPGDEPKDPENEASK
jgi:hypothetical protein